MNDIILESLSEGLAGVLDESASLAVTPKELEESNPPAKLGSGVSVLVSTVGELDASFTLKLSEDFAGRLTAALLELDEPRAFDEVVASTLGEFGNMVIARTTMHLMKKGVTCDLGPPTVLRGESLEIQGPDSRFLGVDYETDWGPIFARVFVKQQG